VLLSSTTLELLDPTFKNRLNLEYWGPVHVKGRKEELEVSELKMDNAPEAAEATQP
jgi:hypothetical protein